MDLRMSIKSNRQFVLNLAIAAFGFLMGAAQPSGKWGWIQFSAGLGLCLGMVVKAAWNETPGQGHGL